MDFLGSGAIPISTREKERLAPFFWLEKFVQLYTAFYSFIGIKPYF